MPLPDILPIVPFTQPVDGAVTLPGSKSITNRALLLAALSDEAVTLNGALFSEDTQIMSKALRRLHFTVEEDFGRHTIRVGGARGRERPDRAELAVGNAGTAARFLTALCAAFTRGEYHLDGVPQMRRRPMKGLIDALRALGADIRCPEREGFFPLDIRARGLAGGEVSIDASESSQMLSALLLAAPLAASDIRIGLSASVREPFVAMTRQMMRQFGAQVGERGGRLLVSRGPYHFAAPQGRYPVEPDATSASYFLMLPLVAGGRLRLERLHRPGPAGAALQGDTQFIAILEKVGLVAAETPGGIEPSFRLPDPRRGVTADFTEFSDTFLTLAATAPLLEGRTRITGIAHTRKQETDRVAGMARELTKLGQKVIETEDALEIHPQPLRAGQVIETYNDHRFAMSFAILGCHDLHGTGKPWLSIGNPGCCAKTFPNFFDVLASLRPKSS